MRGRQVFAALAALLVLGLVWWAQSGTTPDPARDAHHRTTASSSPPDDRMPVVQVEDLPPEAREVLDRIRTGGPFKYPRNDGVTFENREGLLPDQPRGYYEEYTVESSPGDRGPMRLVTGDQRDEVYWTEDHYQSFYRVEGHGIEGLE